MSLRTITSALLVLSGLLSGCAHSSWSYKAVPDVNVARANEQYSQGPVVFRTAAPDAARRADTPDAPKPQTVLVASWRHDGIAYQNNIGRSLVVTFDGPPRPGQFWITAENAVLVTYSSYSPPTRARATLTGSIKIIKVDGKEIIADVAVRDDVDLDTSLFLDHPFDPVNWRAPFVLTGRRTFLVTGPSDPTFDKSAVRWVTQ